MTQAMLVIIGNLFIIIGNLFKWLVDHRNKFRICPDTGSAGYYRKGEYEMTEQEHFKTFSEEYKADLEKLYKHEIHILDFAKKYNLLCGTRENPRAKAQVLWDLTTYKKYKDYAN